MLIVLKKLCQSLKNHFSVVYFLLIFFNKKMSIFYASGKFWIFSEKNWVIYSTNWEFNCQAVGIKKIFKICLRFPKMEQLSGLNTPFEA